MPFQSEKQRRYLWANEPEIARDWTDTYGSGIAKALGGRIKNIEGYDHMLAYITPGEAKSLEDMGGKKVMTPEGIPAYPPQGQSAQHGGKESSSTSSSGGEGGHGVGRHAPTRKNAPDAPTQQNVPDGRTRIQNERQEDFRQKQMADLLNKQQAEKDYNPFGKMKPGPQLGLIGGGAGANIGNWASGFAGSKIGGGLGSMAFGPLGMILGSLFGRGIGQRAYQASQTDEEETLRDIMLGENTLLSNILSKKKTPNTMGGEGLEGIDLSKMVDKRSAKNYIDLDKSYSEFDTIPNEKYHGLNVQRNYMGQPIRSDLVQEVRLTDVQKKGLDAKKNHYKMGLIDENDVWESIKPWDDPQDPSTKQEVMEYLDT